MYKDIKEIEEKVRNKKFELFPIAELSNFTKYLIATEVRIGPKLTKIDVKNGVRIVLNEIKGKENKILATVIDLSKDLSGLNDIVMRDKVEIYEISSLKFISL